MATVRGGRDYSQVLAVDSLGPVAPTVETTILTYVASGDRRITQVSCSGDVRALWKLYVEGSLIESRRGDGRNVLFDWDWPLQVADTETFEVKVTHFKAAETPTFDATVYGR